MYVHEVRPALFEHLLGESHDERIEQLPRGVSAARIIRGVN
jgi:hypothetical protein